MKKNIISTLIILAGLFIGTAQAQQNPNREVIRKDRTVLIDDKINPEVAKRIRHGRENREMMGISNLTENQKNKIKDIRLSEQKQLLQLRNQMGEKRARLRSLETADKVNLKDINKVIDEITTLQGDEMKLKADSKQKIRALLNDEQRIEFDTKRGGERGMQMMHFQQGTGPHSQLQYDIELIEE